MTKGYKSLNSFFSKSNFIGSYIDFQQIPNFNLPEICFLGRSNVGKSSLINQLTKNKKLAKTSKTPGRTQSINLFSINDKIMFVDLPGYGFAKFSENLKNKFEYELLQKQLSGKIDFNYHKITNYDFGKKIYGMLPNLLKKQINVLVFNFIDILSHAKSEISFIKELTVTASAYRSLTESWI